MAGAENNRDKALDVALANIEKQFGKGSVMRLGDETRAPLEVIPTGAISLDIALGLGGLPRGRVVEIYGPESSGKTTVALHAVANAQAAGGIVAFIDAEHALDPEYAQRLGVDTDALLVSQPDSGEQALEIADMLIRSGALDLIVIDSVAALVPRAEIEGEMGDSHVGLQARLMSQALRKMTGALNGANTTAIFINQLREKIGVMFGSPETTTGGRALKFYSSVRLDVRRIETLKDGTEMVGNRTRVKVVKNKVAPPFKQAEFDIMYGQGISREGGLIDVGVEAGLVRKAGAWYTYEGDQLGQGKENARTFLRDNPDLANEIEKKILEKLGIGPSVDTPADGRRRRRLHRRRSRHRPRRHRLLTVSTEARRPSRLTSVRRSTPLVDLRTRRQGGRACDDRGSTRPDGSTSTIGERPVRRDRPGDRERDLGPDADPESVARKILLDQLTGRARTRSELATKLSSPQRPRRRSPAASSTGSRRSGWSTTPPSPASGWSSASPVVAWPGGRWRRSCAARAIDDEIAREALDEIDPDDEVEAARDAGAQPSSARCAASTATRPSAAWSGCSPARATPLGWRSGWSRKSSTWTTRMGWTKRRPSKTRSRHNYKRPRGDRQPGISGSAISGKTASAAHLLEEPLALLAEPAVLAGPPWPSRTAIRANRIGL